MGRFEYGSVSVELLGHASVRIRGGGKTMYIDPYVLDENPEKADIVFVTHEHFDHCATENIRKLVKSNTVVVATEDCLSKLADLNLKTVIPNQELEVNGIKVETVPAYNIGKPFHTPRSNWVGYIITVDGVRIYHAGDTDFIPEMRELRDIDIALLPIGGTFTMDEEEAAKAANAIRPKVVIPMHYNYLRETRADPVKFKNLVEEGIEVRII